MLQNVLGRVETLRHRYQGIAANWLVAAVAFLILTLSTACYPNAVTSVPVNTGNSTSLGVTGSGRLVTRDYAVSDFTEVEVGSAFTVEITRSDSFAVNVTADDNVIDMVGVTKTGQTLKIGLKPGSCHHATYRATIGMPDLRRLQIAEASVGTFTGFTPRTLDLGLSGASQLTGRLDGRQINLAVREASTATLGGSADDLALTASGASHANLGDLTQGTTRASLKEASSATVTVKNKLDADLRSGSNLYYIGNPSLGSVSAVEGSSVRHR